MTLKSVPEGIFHIKNYNFSCNRKSFIKDQSKKSIITLYKSMGELSEYIFFPIKKTIGGNNQYSQCPQNFPAFLMDAMLIFFYFSTLWLNEGLTIELKEWEPCT